MLLYELSINHVLLACFILLALALTRQPTVIVQDESGRYGQSSLSYLLFFIFIVVIGSLMWKGGCNAKFLPLEGKNPELAQADSIKAANNAADPRNTARSQEPPVIVSASKPLNQMGPWAVLLIRYPDYDSAESLLMAHREVTLLKMSDGNYWVIIPQKTKSACHEKILEWFEFEETWSHLNLEMRVIYLEKYRKNQGD